MTSDDLNRIHERIDKEITDRTKLEILVATTAESVRHVADSVNELIKRDKDSHAVPCHMLTSTKEALNTHLAAHAQNMKDWKAVAMSLVEKLIWAALLFGAGAYANLIMK